VSDTPESTIPDPVELGERMRGLRERFEGLRGRL
jgi:hypothetical protein